MKRHRMMTAIAIGLTAIGCSQNDTTPTTPTTTTTQNDASATSELTTASTPTPTTDTINTATTQPATTEPTHTQPNITTPRTKKEVRREVLAVIDQMNAAYGRCLEEPDECDPRATITQFSSVSSPIGRGLVFAVEQASDRGARARDGTAFVRELESLDIDADLNVATVATCEIDEVVLVMGTGNAQTIVNDDVGRGRKVYELVRLVDGRWMIGPSQRIGDLTATDVPLCEELYARGELSPWLLRNKTSDPTGPGQTPDSLAPQDLIAIEDEVTALTQTMRSEIDSCFEEPERCDVAEIVRQYALPDTLIADIYPSLADSWREAGWSYRDSTEINRSIESVTANPRGTLVKLVECFVDDATIVTVDDGAETVVTTPSQIARVEFDWANLADQGWRILSARQTVFEQGDDLPPCFN